MNQTGQYLLVLKIWNHKRTPQTPHAPPTSIELPCKTYNDSAFLTIVWLLYSWQDPRETLSKKEISLHLFNHFAFKTWSSGQLYIWRSWNSMSIWSEKGKGNATHCWNEMKVQLIFPYLNVCCIPPTPAVPIETFAWLNSEFFTWIRKRFLILYFKDQLFIWRCTSIMIHFQLFLLYSL